MALNGVGNGVPQAPQNQVQENQGNQAPAKEGMSTPAKVGLVVLGALAIAGALFIANAASGGIVFSAIGGAFTTAGTAVGGAFSTAAGATAAFATSPLGIAVGAGALGITAVAVGSVINNRSKNKQLKEKNEELDEAQFKHKAYKGYLEGKYYITDIYDGRKVEVSQVEQELNELLQEDFERQPAVAERIQNGDN